MIEKLFLEQSRRGKTHEVQLSPHKAACPSMGIAAIILLLVTIATSCDPGYDEDMVIRNESLHTVTVIPAPYHYYNSMMDSTLILTHETYTLAPNEEVVVQSNGGIGSASLEEGISTFMQYYGDSITFRFAGETEQQIVFLKTDTTGISPYNFSSTQYQYEEKRHYGLFFNGHPSYGKLTFVITDKHYDAARGMDS